MKVAVLLENLFDEKEVIYPYYRLLEAGFEVDLVGSEKGVDYSSKVGLTMTSDISSKKANSKDYVGVVIPGGFSPDYMRRNKHTIKFVSDLYKENKVVASICHGPWMIISAIDLKGKDVTGFYAIKDDIVNAGANYIDEEVVVSDNLITSRTPKDLPIFLKTIIEKLKGN